MTSRCGFCFFVFVFVFVFVRVLIRRDVTTHVGKQILRRIPLFNILDSSTTGLISLRMRSISCNAGYKLFQGGDPAKEIYILRSGKSFLIYDEKILYDWEEKYLRKEDRYVHDVLGGFTPIRRVSDNGGRQWQKFGSELRRGAVVGELGVAYETRIYSLCCLTWCEFYVIDINDIMQVMETQCGRDFNRKYELMKRYVKSKFLQSLQENTLDVMSVDLDLNKRARDDSKLQHNSNSQGSGTGSAIAGGSKPSDSDGMGMGINKYSPQLKRVESNSVNFTKSDKINDSQLDFINNNPFVNSNKANVDDNQKVNDHDESKEMNMMIDSNGRSGDVMNSNFKSNVNSLSIANEKNKKKKVTTQRNIEMMHIGAGSQIGKDNQKNDESGSGIDIGDDINRDMSRSRSHSRSRSRSRSKLKRRRRKRGKFRVGKFRGNTTVGSVYAQLRDPAPSIRELRQEENRVRMDNELEKNVINRLYTLHNRDIVSKMHPYLSHDHVDTLENGNKTKQTSKHYDDPDHGSTSGKHEHSPNELDGNVRLRVDTPMGARAGDRARDKFKKHDTHISRRRSDQWKDRDRDKDRGNRMKHGHYHKDKKDAANPFRNENVDVGTLNMNQHTLDEAFSISIDEAQLARKYGLPMPSLEKKEMNDSNGHAYGIVNGKIQGNNDGSKSA